MGRPEKEEKFGFSRVVAAKAAFKKANETYLSDPLYYLFCYAALAMVTLQLLGARLGIPFYCSFALLCVIQIYRNLREKGSEWPFFPEEEKKQKK